MRRSAGLARGLGAALAFALLGSGALAATKDPINPPPTAADWAALARLPDWSGVWTPNTPDQVRRIKSDPVPWTPAVAKQMAQLEAEEKAGRPKGLFIDCLPEAMPAWMLVSHNALEFLYSPGRVTLLGESDGNRIRRVYTDGRGHPEDPDPSFHGHSVGHWEGSTLVIDTVGVLPQTYIAVSEAVGAPNNGDLHVVERIHLTDPDTLQDDLEITAPHVLTRTWKTSRIYYRHREQKYEIQEGVCLQGSYTDGTDKDGNAIFVPVPHSEGGEVKPLSATP